MQFGRFHALMFVAFGLLLLACQAWLSLSPQKPVEHAPTEVTQPEHKTPPFAGAIGGISLLIGAGLYAANRKRA